MKLLVVEDNQELNNTIKEILEINHYLVDSAYDGDEALDYIRTNEYDLIVLDIMLPKINGYQVCDMVRKKGIKTPILMLTAKDQLKDKVHGLDIGADDYMVKPFEIEELLARIRALLRRSSSEKSDIIRLDNLEVDLRNRIVKKDNKIIELTPKLYCILEQLLLNKGNIVSYESLMSKCWDINDYPTKETVRANIKLLRKLIEDKDKKLIQNITGTGYKINETSA